VWRNSAVWARYHVAHEIGERIDLQVRCSVLGHTQGGGTPLAFDRVLGTRLGMDAVQSSTDKKFGNMLALQDRKIILVPIKSLVVIARQVPLDSQLIRTAESIGVCYRTLDWPCPVEKNDSFFWRCVLFIS
jgi:ATP-dependent phosphofructokinase / diphosphate-dependent phosphofructokinase